MLQQEGILVQLLNISTIKSSLRHHPSSTMFLLLPFLLLNSIAISSQYQDCTNRFKNQVALFEYLYYPGYWSMPRAKTQYQYWVDLEFVNDRTDAKANKNFRFSMHDCGEDTVCIESMMNQWNGYYLEATPLMWQSDFRWRSLLKPIQHTTLYDAKQNPSAKHKIYCTSCQPDTDDTYHDCRIYNVEYQRYWYTQKSGWHFIQTLAQGYPNWFQWRIVSPQTREYWEVSERFENCRDGSEEAPAYASFKKSISSSVTTTTTVEQKIELGLEAIPFLKIASATTLRWSKANVRGWAEEATATIGSAGTKSKMVKPGKKWIIEQFVGEAAFSKIKLGYRFCDILCTSNSNDCSDHDVTNY